MSSSGERSSTPALLIAGSFALSALLALRLALESTSYLLVALALAAAGALAFLWSRRRAGPPLCAALLNLFFVVPELGLRSAGFRHVSGIEFGYPAAAEFFEFALDPELFWKLPPDGELVNSWGFFGPEPRVPKPAGTRRVLYLGDSCSQQGYPLAWPELATAQLAANGVALDEVNLALSGYSSHQGRVLAERHGAELAPDLAVVFFGWNDHWRARGAVDAEKRIDVRWESAYRRVRILQLVRKLLEGPEAPPLDVPRVPPERFRENLLAIASTLRASGAAVLFVTAPTTHDLAVPDYLVERGFVGSKGEALERHRVYAEIVREVAGASGAALLDLERSMREDARRPQWFLEDGIHFTESGRARVAELCVRRVRELALLR